MLFLYCGDMLKLEKYQKGVDFFEKTALSVEQECSFVEFSDTDDATVRQERGDAMEDTKQSNKKFHMNILYVVWLLGLFLFLLVMGNWYCVKVYGGNLFYIAFGKNEVSAEEKAFLKERGTLIYGETLDSFPAQIYDPMMESENGFAIDLMNQLAWEMDTTIEFQPVIWADSFTLLENGTVDMIQISYSEERAEKYYLSAPIYRSKGVVFLRDDGEEITKLQDLQGKTLAGIKADYALTVLKEHYPELKILEYDSIGECAEQLKAQNVDGIVADEQNIMYYAQGEKMFQDYYILDEEVYTEDVVFAVRKEDAVLGKIIDKAVYKLRTQDVLDRVQRKWFLTSILEDALPRQFIYVWLAVLLSGIAGFFVFLFWYIHKHTRILVEVRTRELNVERMRLKTVLDAIPQYLLEVTPEGQVRLMNQRAKKDMNQNALCSGDAAVITQPAILQMITTAKNDAFAQQEVEINQKIYRITCSDIGGLSENENVILLAEDVTLRRIQEKQNIQNNKMMAIGELASGISHELKNPLEIICNYCYALKKGILHKK